MNLIAKNRSSNRTIYYYADGTGHVKSANGKKISEFYTTQNEKVYYFAEWLLEDSVKKQVEKDVKSLISQGLINV